MTRNVWKFHFLGGKPQWYSCYSVNMVNGKDRSLSLTHCCTCQRHSLSHSDLELVIYLSLQFFFWIISLQIQHVVQLVEQLWGQTTFYLLPEESHRDGRLSGFYEGKDQHYTSTCLSFLYYESIKHAHVDIGSVSKDAWQIIQIFIIISITETFIAVWGFCIVNRSITLVRIQQLNRLTMYWYYRNTTWLYGSVMDATLISLVICTLKTLWTSRQWRQFSSQMVSRRIMQVWR